jgi:hypothetical protein
MEEAGKECLFPMELVEISEPIKHSKDMHFATFSGIMKLVVWKKIGDIESIKKERGLTAEILERRFSIRKYPGGLGR